MQSFIPNYTNIYQSTHCIQFKLCDITYIVRILTLHNR